MKITMGSKKVVSATPNIDLAGLDQEKTANDTMVRNSLQKNSSFRDLNHELQQMNESLNREVNFEKRPKTCEQS